MNVVVGSPILNQYQYVSMYLPTYPEEMSVHTSSTIMILQVVNRYSETHADRQRVVPVYRLLFTEYKLGYK